MSPAPTAPDASAAAPPPQPVVLHSVRPGSAARVGAPIGFVVGTIDGIVQFARGLAEGSAAGIGNGYAALFLQPVMATAVFAAVALLLAMAYNVLAPRVGGLELQVR